MKKRNRLITATASLPSSSVARFAGIDMTLHVNHDIDFQVVASTHEFPEGGAAVSLYGGSHFYERNSVKTAYARVFIKCLLLFGLKSLLRS
ncbi:hypothetical protein OKW29_002587 [Paraburkholderia sp. CI3]